MKVLTAAAVLVLLSLGAHAQDEGVPPREFKPMTKGRLDLKLLDQEALAGIDQLKKPIESLTLRQKPVKKYPAASEKYAEPSKGMPVYKPDSTTLFPMLTAIPDSTVLYHLQVKKP